MNSGRYFIPNMNVGPMVNMRATNGFVFRDNLFNRFINGVKSFNWNGLLTSANKTLNVVNQAIPLIRQTKPMISNVKNMVNLARAFKKETNNYNKIKNNIETKKEVVNNNYPNFFI